MKKFLSILVLVLVFTTLVTGTIFANGSQEAKVEKAKLVYWTMWNETEPQGKVIAEAIKDFNANNDVVNIDVNFCGREIRKTLQPALDAGTQIDLWDEDTERVVTNWGKYALVLDEYANKAWEGTDSKPYKEAVNGALINLAKSYNEKGDLQAAPYQPFVFAFMYNKDHFAEAGITATPKTWDEFVNVCAKLKDAGYTPLTTDDAYVDTLIGYYLARAKGYKWVQELVTDSTNKMWDDPVVLQMAKDFEELAKKGYFSETVGSNKWPAGQQDVATDQVSMYLNGTWLVNELMGTTGPDFPWGTFSFPTVKGGVDDITCANYGAQAYQINKDCKNPEEAFKFIVSMTTGKWDKELAQKSYGVPVGGTTDWPVQLEEAKELFSSLTTCYPWAGAIQTNTDKQPIIAKAFTNLISGKITAEEFVSAMK